MTNSKPTAPVATPSQLKRAQRAHRGRRAQIATDAWEVPAQGRTGFVWSLASNRWIFQPDEPVGSAAYVVEEALLTFL